MTDAEARSADDTHALFRTGSRCRDLPISEPRDASVHPDVNVSFLRGECLRGRRGETVARRLLVFCDGSRDTVRVMDACGWNAPVAVTIADGPGIMRIRFRRQADRLPPNRGSASGRRQSNDASNDPTSNRGMTSCTVVASLPRRRKRS